MTQTLLASLFFPLLACSPDLSYAPGFDAGVCTTPCGAVVLNLTEERCTALARYETLTVQVLDPMLQDPKKYGVCRRLLYWTVKIMDTHGTGYWVDEWGRSVGGLTYPEFNLIELGTDRWEKSAFAHEATHAWHYPEGDAEHLNWGALGYFKAFDEINRRYLADAGT